MHLETLLEIAFLHTIENKQLSTNKYRINKCHALRLFNCPESLIAPSESKPYCALGPV